MSLELRLTRLQVNYIEADTRVKVNTLVSQPAAPAGLTRLSHAANGGSGYIFDNSSGAGITAFIVDTGILVSHQVCFSKCAHQYTVLTSAGIRWTC